MLDQNALSKLDSEIRRTMGPAFEVFESEGDLYLNAPMDASEAESTDAPCCVLVCANDADLTYHDALRWALRCEGEAYELMDARG